MVIIWKIINVIYVILLVKNVKIKQECVVNVLAVKIEN